MHSMITVVALFNTIQAISEKPNWQADYRAALTAAANNGKPMAVFIGRGTDGWTKVAQEAALNKEVLELLKDKYVCVYVNTETTTGKSLADAFEIKSTGLVISDAKGAKQAFSHEGSLTQEDLKLALVRYSDTNRVPTTTESLASIKAPVAAPAYIRSGCANGQCGSSVPSYSSYPSSSSPITYSSGCANGQCGSSVPSYSSYPSSGSPITYPTVGYPSYGIPAQGNCPNGRCPTR